MGWTISGVIMSARQLMPIIMLGLSACAQPVVATFEDDDDLYRGKATPILMDPYKGDNGELSMSNGKGKVCTGTYYYANSDLSTNRYKIISLGGVAAVRCNDGTSAKLEFRSITRSSGWGIGKSSDGKRVHFTYGMGEEEAKMYLNYTEDNLDGDLPAVPSQGAGKKTEVPGKVQELGLGTGFFISQAGHILTNNHVVRGCEYMKIILPDGSNLKGETIFNDSINDLAVVKVDYRPPVIASFPASTSYRVGEDVATFGFGLGYELSKSGIFTTGTINALSGYNDDSRFIHISAILQHGNSGGPLSDSMGNVIGVNSQGLEATIISKNKLFAPETANFSIKELVVKTFLKAHGIPFAEVNRTKPMSNPDLSDYMRSYSVMARCFGVQKKSKD